jgi:hypothetical protein
LLFADHHVCGVGVGDRLPRLHNVDHGFPG